jgi:hypothetical protein
MRLPSHLPRIIAHVLGRLAMALPHGRVDVLAVERVQQVSVAIVHIVRVVRIVRAYAADRPPATSPVSRRITGRPAAPGMLATRSGGPARRRR